MTVDAEKWQKDGLAAFEWINAVYEQSHVLFEDASRSLQEGHWTITPRVGGSAYSAVLSNWPFLYLKAIGAVRGELDESATESGAFFGVVYFDGGRSGPYCFGGAAWWNQPGAKCDHWVLCNAFGFGTYPERFDVEPGTISTARPVGETARKYHPGLERLRWFRVPLAKVSSADRLGDIVRAAKALATGDDRAADEIVDGLA